MRDDPSILNDESRLARPRILIVGAGATGLPIGYHLWLAGADITFLVRPGTRDRLLAPQRLYSYDDNSLKTFDGYAVVDDLRDAALREMDFVLITLDGTASREQTGQELLSALGAALHDSETVVIMSAFGLGVRDYYLTTMGLPKHRLLHGFLGMLSHQTSADLPLHPPTEAAIIEQARVAYRHSKSRVGFQLSTHNRAAARRFADLYDSSGISRCTTLPPTLDEIFCSIAFPVYLASDLAGWPPFDVLVRDKKLWRLACRAQREIASLPRHGVMGKLVALAMGPTVTARVHLRMATEMLPLDYQAFNRFHHGGKVRAQDLRSLHDALRDGEREGKPMRALRELLELTTAG
jgi:hypothetical protein